MSVKQHFSSFLQRVQVWWFILSIKHNKFRSLFKYEEEHFWITHLAKCLRRSDLTRSFTAGIKHVPPVSSLTSIIMEMACVLGHCNKGAHWRGFMAQTKGPWPKGKLRTCISDFSLKFVTQRYANVFIFSPIKTQEIKKKKKEIKRILLNITSSLKAINFLNKGALGAQMGAGEMMLSAACTSMRTGVGSPSRCDPACTCNHSTETVEKSGPAN